MIISPTAIETVTGRFVDLVEPNPNDIVIEDIAWALSRMPRYVAHTTSPIPWSIGQHSVFVTKLAKMLFSDDCEEGLMRSFRKFVNEKTANNRKLAESMFSIINSKQMPTELALELLLHDASEAYIVDVPTPLKMSEGFREVYARLENQMMFAIRKAVNLPADHKHHNEYQLFVKWADMAALTIEAYHLIHSRGKNWTRLLELDMMPLQIFESPQESIKVYKSFLNLYTELNASRLARTS